MIKFNAKQLLDSIKDEMVKSPDGLEPKDLIMNASLNIITFFVLGETLTFNQPEFQVSFCF